MGNYFMQRGRCKSSYKIKNKFAQLVSNAASLMAQP